MLLCWEDNDSVRFGKSRGDCSADVVGQTRYDRVLLLIPN